ncbi:MAG: pyridoxal phosphate-dependent aminotransferase [Terriglobia bacterium]|nr:pyridoxal phosphate-dependent aminotransferase [Terriglobia bacterium]
MFSRRTNWKLTKNKYTEALERFRASGRELLDLTASNPTEVGLQYESERLLKALASPRGLDYEPASKGLLPARKAVAGYYAEKGIEVSAEQIFLTVSTSEAYTYVFRLLCDPGDEVLVPQPSYPLFEFLADLQDVKLVPYELIYDHGWQIDFHSLECAMASNTRAVLVVHPNNPTGSYVKKEEKRLLDRICDERGLAIIVDEVFLDYSVGGDAPLSFAGSWGALTLTLSGLSKISGLPQMKSAWMALSGPESVAQEASARLEVIADTYLSPNAPVQWALPEMLAMREGIQQQLKARVKENLATLDGQLRKQSLCQRLQVEGGWYAVLRVPAIRSDEELAIQLLEQENVLVQPGHFFDFVSEGYLVLSLITREDVCREGIARILSFLAE